MKKLILMLMATLSFSYAMAQAEMDFPFQGGNKVMTDYFTANVIPTAAIKYRAASGTVVMKFTADEKGSIIKMVVYYADDASLAEPIIKALKGTNGKWIIPDKQKTYDFLIPFSISIDAPTTKASKAMLQFYNSRSPIIATDQIPLNLVSLLPTIQIKYAYEAPAPVRTKGN
ncbi:hypothetical protein HQ865_19510 [Mucilaginibacter mali]|uniref:TonB C-terminal domain-containing protein n=1 Tax=Mucilaginibacter mali TaxID=2740462 RepID=A0A7D4UGH9_9SPHI|nr:hypothetical protein [Mucilaginibacter mali]QKJ31856.1 hypothetical protein HQ865_19510 [Mucilaginibacter mali]